MSAPADAAQRAAALDPRRSFCISAPAGSGKTGLLVQRLLLLLARVETPEQVVAITFTRKAAAEMRARVLQALAAAGGARPAAAHEARLWDLAQAVRERDAAAAWGLLDNPTRLAIRTIDSFCADLARQMPVSSGFGGPLRIADNADTLYREAVEQFLHSALSDAQGERRADMERLLLHLDNRWDAAIELLSALLQRREQWQPVFGSAGFCGREREFLAASTEALLRARLRRIRDRLRPWLGRIARLLDWSCAQRGVATSFDADALALAGWRELAELLLTKAGGWRKTVSVRQGFPRARGAADEARKDLLGLLEELRESDGDLLAALREVRSLPDARGDGAHWETLAALTRLLPGLGAELLLVFQRRGEVDHAQVALGALAALGEDTQPGDIALRLDYRIEHLLVDEFQDTSSLQFELIRRVVRGWAEHNATSPGRERTLLLVGDPMQSIYGFREAKVGLFMRARDRGIGDLALEPLALTVNFRSTATILDWVNETFAATFPPRDDPQLGAVVFAAAQAAVANGAPPSVALYAGEGGREQEAAALCREIEAGLADPKLRRIAVLGRSRGHLEAVIGELRRRCIPFAAREFAPLYGRPLIRDLQTLCAVLLDRFDRFAWLSLLRCPAIALCNRDLLCVSRCAPTAHAFGGGGVAALAPAALSAEGRQRLKWLAGFLDFADHYRDRLAFRVWVEECWLRFAGPAALRDEADLRDARYFFTFLEDLSRDNDAISAALLDERLQRLFSAPADEQARVQVMTLHKAKGLEFDWVFLPALDRGTRREDRPLLLWDEFALPGQTPAFLLDLRPPESGDAEHASLYAYLYEQARQKAAVEAMRLFYVGCTRARRRLWLSGALPWDEARAEPRRPRAGSLLAATWEALQGRVRIHRAPAGAPAQEPALPGYRRIARLPEIEALPSSSSPSSPPPLLPPAGVAVDQRAASRVLGTALHRCLESLVHRAALPPAPDDSLRALLRVSLLDELGPIGSLADLQRRGEAALTRSLADPWLRWALDPARGERRAEYALSLAREEGATALVLDYFFYDSERDEYWIVDYKSAGLAAASAPSATPVSGASGTDGLSDFLDRQLALYRPQLQTYREAVSALYGPGIRCALYFASLGMHRELG